MKIPFAVSFPYMTIFYKSTTSTKELGLLFVLLYSLAWLHFLRDLAFLCLLFLLSFWFLLLVFLVFLLSPFRLRCSFHAGIHGLCWGVHVGVAPTGGAVVASCSSSSSSSEGSSFLPGSLVLLLPQVILFLLSPMARRAKPFPLRKPEEGKQTK